MSVSKYYPYEKVQGGYLSFKGSEEIPYKIVDYLLDLPDKSGYFPPDDNDYPRVRLIKYLWYDGEDPLRNPLPDVSKKLSLKFDPNNPVLDTDELIAAHPKGYRIYPQIFWGQAQGDAMTVLKIYMGNESPQNPFRSEMSVVFEILSNVDLENNTKTDAYSRCWAIEQCIKEALHGVNIAGVGVFNYDVRSYARNGSYPVYDTGKNVGRTLTMSLSWMESDAAAAGGELFWQKQF